MNNVLGFDLPFTLWHVISIIGIGIFILIVVVRVFYYLQNQGIRNAEWNMVLDRIHESRLAHQQALHELKTELWQALHTQRQNFDQHQLQGFGLIQTHLQQNNESIGQRIDHLNETLNSQLHSLGGYVEQRLSDGLVKTTETFGQIMERLSLIDAAQQQMSELSGQVMSLQQILVDKRARGAFGEMQLMDLIQNTLPPASFKFQHTFSNQKRADCVLFLPPPTGTIAIDAKFPLENFRRSIDHTLADLTRRAAQIQFRQDMRNHIQAVATKYIIPSETTDSVILFIPAETIFAEIHTNHSVIVEEAQQARVWLTSPSTLMAILTTVKAVLKDAQTREQAHLIQKHLNGLKVDFIRFQQRMHKLAQHVQQAHEDIQDAQVSAKKITQHFERVEKVDLPPLESIKD